MLFVKIAKYIGFCLYRRSYLIWSPVICDPGSELRLSRGAIVNRTYVTDKNRYIYLFLLAIVGPIYYGPP